MSVNGFPGTLWLTQQERVDRDYAMFGEASYDITPKLTLTAARFRQRLLRLRRAGARAVAVPDLQKR